jgi:antitoxin CptB
MGEDIEVRRRRAVWRAGHRGTKELDLLVGRFADAHLAAMGDEELARFETFLAVSEPQLQAWLLAPDLEPPGGETEFADIVTAIRTFHGLA